MPLLKFSEIIQSTPDCLSVEGRPSAHTDTLAVSLRIGHLKSAHACWITEVDMPSLH